VADAARNHAKEHMAREGLERMPRGQACLETVSPPSLCSMVFLTHAIQTIHKTRYTNSSSIFTLQLLMIVNRAALVLHAHGGPLLTTKCKRGLRAKNVLKGLFTRSAGRTFSANNHRHMLDASNVLLES
jgi:hypothetical protein